MWWLYTEVHCGHIAVISLLDSRRCVPRRSGILHWTAGQGRCVRTSEGSHCWQEDTGLHFQKASGTCSCMSYVCLYWEHVCTELILKHCLMGLVHSSKVFSKHLVIGDIVGDADLFLNYANAIHNPLSGYVCECKWHVHVLIHHKLSSDYPLIAYVYEKLHTILTVYSEPPLGLWQWWLFVCFIASDSNSCIWRKIISAWSNIWNSQ